MIEMKQIIPFRKELLFKTKVSEITSISLEHTLTLREDDLISGEFYITGDYKMTEGSINREKFSFKIPFDIALDSRYDLSSIVIDIDNFYYEIINNESLQVNIDVYVEGEKLEEKIIEEKKTDLPINNLETPEEIISNFEEEDSKNKPENNERGEKIGHEQMDSLEERGETEVEEDRTFKVPTPNIQDDFPNKEERMIPKIKKEENIKEELPEQVIHYQAPVVTELEKEEPINIIKNNEFNIFENIDNSDTYVTYYVYIVKESDNIDKITEKYGVTKEDISLYNNLEDIKPGVKLIIPNKHE